MAVLAAVEAAMFGGGLVYFEWEFSLLFLGTEFTAGGV